MDTSTSGADTTSEGNNSQGDLPKPSAMDHAAKALAFNKQIERTSFEHISSLPYHLGKFLHSETLDALGIRTEIDSLIDSISWGTFFHLRMPAFT